MNKITRKKTTIDDLARMVQGGFLEMDKNVNKRFDLVDERLAHIEEIILSQHRERISHLEDRVQSLEADFRSLVSKK